MDSQKRDDHGALGGAAIHEKWVSMYRTPEAQRFYEIAFDEIVRRLAPVPGAVILDAGCGSCAKSVLLAARGMRVVATDFSEDALTLGAKTVKSQGLEQMVTLRQGDLMALPFKDGEFHYAICWGVLMHVPHLEHAMAELARVVAPGGVLVLSEGNVNSLQSMSYRFLKRLLGRDRGNVVRTSSGLETHERTAQGSLVTRQTDMDWLSQAFGNLGFRTEARIAGQFSEVFAVVPWRWLRHVVHFGNRAWFNYIRLPGPAYGNILFFRKDFIKRT